MALQAKDLALCCAMGSIPSPGTSACLKSVAKKKKKKKKEKEKETISAPLVSLPLHENFSLPGIRVLELLLLKSFSHVSFMPHLLPVTVIRVPFTG